MAGTSARACCICRREDARRAPARSIAAIGPLWSWHEVWLVAAGGRSCWRFRASMAVCVRRVLSRAVAGAVVVLLRGISIEVGGHLDDRCGRSAWDFVFAVSSVLLAVLFGAALGNVIRGVPLDAAGAFSMPLFTDFRARGRVGILDWYTLSVALFATVLLPRMARRICGSRRSAGARAQRALARRLWVAVARAVPGRFRSRREWCGRSSISDAGAAGAWLACRDRGRDLGALDRPARKPKCGRLPVPARSSRAAWRRGRQCLSGVPAFDAGSRVFVTAYSGAAARGLAIAAVLVAGRRRSRAGPTSSSSCAATAARCGRHTIRRVSTDAGSLLSAPARRLSRAGCRSGVLAGGAVRGRRGAGRVRRPSIDRSR